MSRKSIGVLVGSLRRESYNRKIAAFMEERLAGRFDVKFLDIGRLVLYNQDLESDGAQPREWLDFRAEVKALDGVLFVTPEYNRSVPPVLKNALDVASRPYAENAWSGKAGAVVSVALGAMGGFGASQRREQSPHRRQSAACLNIRMMAQPEAYIGNAAALLDEAGAVKDESTKAFLQKTADAFADWVELVSAK